MYKINGKVLVKETGIGIPNLQVVIYDIDNRKLFLSDAAPLNTEIPASNLFWQTVSGDRLGSVLTDSSGGFELAFEEQAFVSNDPEKLKRPDLVLFVVAPEDTQIGPKGETLPYPALTASRILSTSYDIVVNSGKSEAYVIRLSTKLLEKFAILYPGQRETSSSSSELINSIDQARQLEETVFKHEKAHVQKKVNRSRGLATAAKRFVANFSSAPLQFRDSPLFVGDAKAPDALPKLTAALSEAQNQGLLNFEAYKNFARPQFTISLPEEDLTRLIREDVATVSGTDYTINSVCSLLSARSSGLSLQRVRDLFTVGDESLPITPGDGDGATAPSGSSTDTELSPTEQIQQRVLGQIQHLETPSLAKNSKGVMNNLLEMLQQLKAQAQGPADVAALRDFHSLQIAFPHVWAEAFDSGLLEGAVSLYSQIVRLHEDYGVSVPPSESIRDINEYREFLSETRDALSYMAVTPIPTDVARLFPELDHETWNSLSATQQNVLAHLASEASSLDEETKRRDGLPIIANPDGSLGRAERLILELEEMLLEPYAFQYFAPNSFNYGLMVTYRQEWVPETYQVGNLVATIPLAPNEIRRITTKRVVKTSRSQRELEKSLSIRQDESRQTGRAEDEILNRAQVTTNFQMTAEGSLNFGIGHIGGSSQFSLNQAEESSRVKKSFHEAVMKASYEYKSERSIEVETQTQQESESTTSGELSNPNNELTVTYLLYELERRYKINEKLHRLMPVILVAQDIPAPNEIDEDWLLAYQWILQRVLLDDSLKPALKYLSDEFVGNELSLEIKQANWKAQKELVTSLEGDINRFMDLRASFRQALSDMTEGRDRARAAEPGTGERVAAAIFTGGLSELFGSGDGASENLEAARKAAEMRVQYIQESLAEAQSKLSRAAEALNQATSQYTKALEAQSNKRTAIDQLRVHVKQNILYYMQAVWDHEPPDQRFFRLYNLKVELPGPATQVCRMRLATSEEIARGIPGTRRDGQLYVIECDAPEAPSSESRIFKSLVEIADLDKPLGYKGNYMIFPLKECTYLTDFMMQEYIDDYFGIRDPDEAGNFTTEELLKYAEQVREELADEERRVLDQIIAERLSNPRRDSETIIVPTGQLFIEALPGAHSLLEPFKMLHRGLDVAKVAAEIREANLENLRRAARLVEGEREDPEIDKKIVVEGSSPGVIVPPEA